MGVVGVTPSSNSLDDPLIWPDLSIFQVMFSILKDLCRNRGDETLYTGHRLLVSLEEINEQDRQ